MDRRALLAGAAVGAVGVPLLAATPAAAQQPGSQRSFTPTSSTPAGRTAELQALIDELANGNTPGAGYTGYGTVVVTDLHEMAPGIVVRRDIKLIGRGFNTGFVFTSDPGPAGWAITLEGSGGFSASLERLRIQGPGHRTGAAPQVGPSKWIGCSGGGIGLYSHANLTDVACTGFHRGLGMYGDHNRILGGKFSENLINVYYPGSAPTKGDHSYLAVDMTGAVWACIFVEGSGFIDHSEFIGSHVGFAPYGILKRDNVFDGAGVSTHPCISATVLHGMSFEDIGNAAIKDTSTGSGGGSETFHYVTFDNVGFSWNAGYSIPGAGRPYAVQARHVVGTKVSGGSRPFTPGTVATYYYSSGALHIESLGLYGGPALLGGEVGGVPCSPNCSVAEIWGAGRWQGHTSWVTQPDIVAGDVLRISSGTVTGRRTDTIGIHVFGVAVHDVSALSLGGGNYYVPVATDGVVAVKLGGPVSAGDRLMANASGRAIAWDGLNRNYVFAIALGSGANGDVSTCRLL